MNCTVTADTGTRTFGIPLIRHQQQQQRQKAEITISRLAQYLLAEILPEK